MRPGVTSEMNFTVNLLRLDISGFICYDFHTSDKADHISTFYL